LERTASLTARQMGIRLIFPERWQEQKTIQPGEEVAHFAKP
jgi:hypothetical protein